jgi:hypothetical protein
MARAGTPVAGRPHTYAEPRQVVTLATECPMNCVS